MDQEMIKKIDEISSLEEAEELRKQIEASKQVEKTDLGELLQEEQKKDDSQISKEEERSLINSTEDKKVEERSLSTIKIKEEEKMNEEKKSVNVFATPEYRTAWAKKLMGYKESEFSKEEIRALGDAITTTSPDFIASGESTQGINNGGLFIPTDVRLEMLKLLEEVSPFLRDVRKIAVASNINFPYLNEADDAEWYAELEETKNEGVEFNKITLTGHELAKQIVITWKLEKMAVEEFINFIKTELTHKMGRALATAVLYGDGDEKPTGAVHSLTPVTGEEAIAAMITNYKNLKREMRVGAKTYISSSVAIDIVGYKDNNGNYPYLMGLDKIALFAIEIDPFLVDGDILTGNPKNYILNTVEGLSVNKESKATQRRNIYSIYAIYDGKPYPEAFSLANIEKI